jgi:hypothetical protein
MTLTEILTQVAEGKLSVADAEKLIRQGPPRPPGPLRPARGRRTHITALVFLLIGAVFTGVGAYLLISEWSFLSGARETQGTVVRLVPGSRGSFAPVFRYEVDGVVHEAQSAVSSSPPAFAVGDPVTVYYQPAHPEAGHLKSVVHQWLFPSLFGGLGLLFLTIGAALALKLNARQTP